MHFRIDWKWKILLSFTLMLLQMHVFFSSMECKRRNFEEMYTIFYFFLYVCERETEIQDHAIHW